MSRLTTWHERLSRAFVGICRLSMLCVLSWVGVLLLDVLWPGAIETLMRSDHVLAVVATWILLALAVFLPLLVPCVTMAFLVSSMLARREPSTVELRWSWVAWLMCAMGLAMVLSHELCSQPDTGSQNCRQQVLLFVLDQFNHGSFGDVFDVFDISFSSLGFDSLGAWGKFHVLTFRMLCAVSVVALAMLWLSGPLERLARTGPVQRLHLRFRQLFLFAGYASLASVVLWVLALVLESSLAPGLFDRLDNASAGAWKLLQVVLTIPMVAIPAVIPIVSLGHLVLSMLVGHQLRGREFALTTFVMVVCTFGLWLFVEETACTGSQEAVAACQEQVGGFVADQFYKGGFADVFDVYELKFGDVDSDALSFVAKLMVLNFRFLCAVYVVGVVLALVRWRDARRTRRSGGATGSPQAPAKDAEPMAPHGSAKPGAATDSDSGWPQTVFADTLPFKR